MKPIAGIIAVGLTLWLALFFRVGIRGSYEYERTIGSYWSLSVKASALDAKADYLDKFVAAIDSAKLSGHDALLFPTPDNDVGQNIAALKTLQTRMREIRKMDVTGFAYQQAISQITAQEQGEAKEMLDVIEGRWWLDHHPYNWDWIGLVIALALVLGAFISWVFFFIED